MKLTLPVSSLINDDNVSSVPGIDALEYKMPKTVKWVGKTLFFHAAHGIINGGFTEFFDSVAGFLASNRIGLFSCDFGPAADAVENPDFYYRPIGRILSAREIEDKVSDRISYVKSNYSGEIALENMNFFKSPAYEHVCEPDFITKIVRQNDIYLLLDVAHALVSAFNMNIRASDYISSLPLDRVMEIHISGPTIIDGICRDSHDKPGDFIFETLDSILPKVRPDVYVAVEYYKDYSGMVDIYCNLEKKYAVKR